MVFLSLNNRGMGGEEKCLSLRRYFDILKPNLIMVQETMLRIIKARDTFTSFLPSWEICTSNSKGFASGLLATWNPDSVIFCPYMTCVGILLVGVVQRWNRVVCILNYYGPYGERQYFWEKVANSGILQGDHLILVGYLKLTISVREIWGSVDKGDLMPPCFTIFFKEHQLIDV